MAKTLKDMESGSNKSNLRVLEVMAEDCGDLAANFAIPAMPAVIVFADGEVKNPLCVLELLYISRNCVC